MLKMIVALQNRYHELRDREEGQAYVEYGILLAIVAVGLIVALGVFKDDIIKAFEALGAKVDGS